MYHEARASGDPDRLQVHVALNQVGAFFYGLSKLIRENEVDRQLAREMFHFAYHYWDKHRIRIYEASDDKVRYLFEAVPFDPIPAPRGPGSKPEYDVKAPLCHLTPDLALPEAKQLASDAEITKD